ncbi:P2Y purinoceptor 12-like [Callorhinchus milii]|uniref:Purinergic receptor P2Y12 n=1 Tax=Callorhinchus milii TaxID=7868 RepID=A0A4W3I3I9_CALMI|nr:P2Y purinoceptor 12-like [Callorhinchus milii]|eukprot:gi/632968687/ref/XP_007900661.1/ PREDICTED: P2Y purinoceptor 12-like [Callorhinchus milii]
MAIAGTGSPLNYSNFTEKDSCNADRQVSQVVFSVLYSVLFIAGITMNSLAVWVFFQIPSKSNFIVYLKNTVVADLLMTLTFPFKIIIESSFRTPTLQFIVCQITSVSFYFTMYISIMFLGLISADRYQKAARPFGSSAKCRPRSAKICSVAVWLVMFLLSLPNMVLIKGSSMPKNQRKCSSLKTDMGLKWHEIVTFVCQVIFWCNLAIIVGSYLLISRELYKSYQRTRGSSSQANRQVNFNVFIVLGVFFVCFVPFHFARIPYTLSQTRGAFDCTTQIALYYTKESTLCLAAFNACLDPFIYFFLCRSFRNTLFEKLNIHVQRLRQRGEMSTSNEIAL